MTEVSLPRRVKSPWMRDGLCFVWARTSTAPSKPRPVVEGEL